MADIGRVSRWMVRGEVVAHLNSRRWLAGHFSVTVERLVEATARARRLRPVSCRRCADLIPEGMPLPSTDAHARGAATYAVYLLGHTWRPHLLGARLPSLTCVPPLYVITARRIGRLAALAGLTPRRPAFAVFSVVTSLSQGRNKAECLPDGSFDRSGLTAPLPRRTPYPLSPHGG